MINMNKQRGFTLIELLIVIVVLGILAVAILSAINPIEQINKATDSGTQSDAAELINGMERYYASNQQWPWGTDPLAGPTAFTQVSPAMATELGLLETAGEVKKEFTTRSNLTHIYIKLVGDVATSQYIVACFEPLSNTFKNNEKQRATLSGFDDLTRTSDVMFCVPGPEVAGNTPP